MILVWLILIPLLGGALAWIAEAWHPRLARWLALLAMLGQLAVALTLWSAYGGSAALTTHGGPWWLDIQLPWIPQFGIGFHLALDGLNLLLVLLTAVLGVLAVLASWREIERRVGFYFFLLLVTLAAITGLFLALDLFLFYFFFEAMLIPLYFLIDIWGHENRHYAAIKFFIFTQVGGLFLLLAILGLYFIHSAQSGVYTFDYFALLHTTLAPATARWLLLGFLFAFLVKLPAVPLHSWLPDAHTQAPVAGSVLLAGLVLKVGAYGLLRFAAPLFPDAARAMAPALFILAIISIFYGALLAFGQTDVKRLVAYSSISHMGFVLLGVFVGNTLALQGAVIVMLAHGITTGALFILVGALQERLHTRELGKMGGLWTMMPRAGGFGLLLAMAMLGLPGLSNFIGEFLVLLGAYQVSVPIAVLASAGFIVAMIYSLWLVQRVFFGPVDEQRRVPDLDAREQFIFAIAAALTVWIGLYPQPIFDTVTPLLRNLQQQPPVTLQNDTDALPPVSSEVTLHPLIPTLIIKNPKSINPKSKIQDKAPIIQNQGGTP